ncbi:hypothetical protein [Litchfieldella qijiaojingensis]|uniref:hypothetical protein n=1 Tax=Litchfieldella qijiaojingensis TaxID=980347 RepID=UPI001E4339C3|nr:hypothetical protein [Halomonas qijiaojingensis]
MSQPRGWMAMPNNDVGLNLPLIGTLDIDLMFLDRRTVHEEADDQEKGNTRAPPNNQFKKTKDFFWQPLLHIPINQPIRYPEYHQENQDMDFLSHRVSGSKRAILINHYQRDNYKNPCQKDLHHHFLFIIWHTNVRHTGMPWWNNGKFIYASITCLSHPYQTRDILQ